MILLFRRGTNREKRNTIRLFAAAAALLFAAFGLSGCAKRRADPGEVKVVEVSDGTPAPTAADPGGHTVTDTLEEKILSGYVHPLNGGSPLGAGWAGESVDIDSDGTPELIDVRDIDGCPTVCIDGTAFMADGNRVYLASPDGKRIMFLEEKTGSEGGYTVFYPDESGGTYCRVFAVAREGRAADLTPRSSLEELIANGLDLMLYNPAVYSSSFGAEREIDIDMDGDGVSERVVFGAVSLSVNGISNSEILSTAMPRFVYEAETGAILLCGSSGDCTLALRYTGGELKAEISYTSLL